MLKAILGKFYYFADCFPSEHFMQLRFTCFFLLFLMQLSQHVFGQYNSATVSPGNRIQYGKQIQWQRYSNSAAHFYFASGSDSLCKYTVKQYAALLKKMEQESGLKSRGKSNVIIYPSPYEFFETNIGSNVPRQYSFPTITPDAGGRMALAFEGSYELYTQQLSVALMRRLWEQNISQSGKLNFSNYERPELRWFKEGFIHYTATGFSLQDNDSLFALLSRDTTLSLDALIGNPEQQLLLAKGFCWFLTRHYRKDALKQIAFQLKQKKSLETALRLVTKRNLQELNVVYAAFLKHIYALPDVYFSGQQTVTTEASTSGKTDTLVLFRLNENSTVLSTAKNGQRSIYLKQKARIKLLQSFQTPLWLEHKSPNYPLMDYNNEKLYLLNRNKGSHQMIIYNAKSHTLRTVILPQGIDGISDFKIVSDQVWLFAAYTKGRSDIISFNPEKFSIKAITNDMADNIKLSINPEHPGTVRYRSGFPQLLRADTDSPDFRGAKPYGLYEKGIGSGGSGKSEELLLQNDSAEFELLLSRFGQDKHNIPASRHYWLQVYLQDQTIKDSIRAAVQNMKSEQVNNPGFLSGLLTPQNDTKSDSSNDTVFQAKNVRPYLLQLSNLWFNASVNNDYFINRLQPYQAQLGIYKFPEIGGMLTGGYADIFENHEFNVGYRMPSGAEGSDFFFRYKNKKQRLDWNVLYHRKVENLQPNAMNQWMDDLGRPYPPTAKIKSYYFEAGLMYPMGYRSKIDFTVAVRDNKTVFLSTDQYSLQYPALKSLWNINTISYTFNNIKQNSENGLMLRGIKYRTCLDGIFGMGKPNKNQFSYGINQHVDWYQPLHKWINWHNHVALGYSGGSSYILYNFGGMDNNIITRVDSNAVFEQNAPYIFQQLVAPLRGFQQNTMWGNTYGVVNSELFVQVFGGVIKSKTSFQFINLMQLGAFADLSYSKSTWNPISDWQRRNSYGFSLKTILANYPVRVDIAFPYNFNQKPMVHLSLHL